ncbi:MAG: doxx family protein, partial [Planctomycetota bacterium]|nr:doxx family protein [Planctomycetota bacterium]
WEVAIGIGMLINRCRKATFALLLLHMAGTFMPFFTCPELVWADAPFVWTLVGQYIMKNIIFVGAALMVFARAEDS